MGLSRAEAIISELGHPPFPVDPYPLYHELRSLAPVFMSDSGMCYVTTYDGCSTVFRSSGFGQGEGAKRVRLDPRFEGSATLQSLGRMLTFIDPPDHTRLRKLVSRAFTPMVIDRLRYYIRDLVDSLLDPLQEAGGGDLVADYADHIPVTVICELLGVPHEDHARCYEWSEAISLTVEYVVPDEALKAADDATLAYEAYFRDLIAERRTEPGDDLLSGLIAANDETDRLSEEELVSMAVLLLGAGFETTRNLIGSGLLALLRNPDQLAQLRDDPQLIRGAVEEFLRYESPVQTAVSRFALRDVEVDGFVVPEGTIVGAVIAAANRDPARFADPDRVDIDRQDNHPLTFAPGIHYCLGASVARLEGEIAIDTAIRRFPDLALADDMPAMRNTCALGQNPRGPLKLPVSTGRP
jgi:cytochrome P450